MKKNANLPALIFMFALLIVWQCIAMGMNAAYILPSPTQVLVRLWELRKPLFTAHLPATMLCTGVGLAISIALGLLLAIVMDASPSAEKMLYPLIVASQTIPTTALAPLFVLWFGYTIWSKVLVTVLITFFPIAMTVFDGFRSAKTDMVDMLKTFGAGDSYSSAFTYALLKGSDMSTALQYAAAASSITISGHSCSDAMPSLASVENYMASHEYVLPEII